MRVQHADYKVVAQKLIFSQISMYSLCVYCFASSTFNIVQQLVVQVLLHVRPEKRRVHHDRALLIFDEEHLERSAQDVVIL